MSSLKQYKLAEQNALKQRQVVAELETLAKDVERCERTITDLKSELEEVNQKHQARKTTRDDIAYLTDLLRCANKKLTWEKHIASLQKRTPALLEKMAELMNDPHAPPDDSMRDTLLRTLQSVQAAMERLQNVKME